MYYLTVGILSFKDGIEQYYGVYLLAKFSNREFYYGKEKLHT